MKDLSNISSNPYRILFPAGVFLGLWGILIWLPLIFIQESYPVLAHRYLMLNGFVASFVAGFLMTAVPKFSQTQSAKLYEVISFLLVTFIGLLYAYLDNERIVFLASSLQAIIILIFLFVRIFKRKANPPYSFIFIFAGLFLWIFSGLMSAFNNSELFKVLHYEGAIAAIILGVGSRLLPGILGHVEIVQNQRNRYENEKPFILTVPLHFFVIIGLFIGSYFLDDPNGIYMRTLVVAGIGLYYWKLTSLPKIKSALTWSLWISCWLIIISFMLKAFWIAGVIHASHSFFICGIFLLTLLVATRVLQSHGPKDTKLEDSKILYIVTFLIILAAATRVSAFLMPEHYLKHLGYSSFVLSGALVVWSWKYLRYVK